MNFQFTSSKKIQPRVNKGKKECQSLSDIIVKIQKTYLTEWKVNMNSTMWTNLVNPNLALKYNLQTI